MRCPRCDSPLDEAAARCPACRAPLQLLDEPLPSRLDCALDLDRRRTRTPVPAATPPPVSTPEEDLGDLSFDAPADDGPWTLAPEAAPLAEPEAAPLVEPEPARDEMGADDPDEAYDDEELEDELDPASLALPVEEHVAARRGRLLSMASLALASAAALIAVLSSR